MHTKRPHDFSLIKCELPQKVPSPDNAAKFYAAADMMTGVLGFVLALGAVPALMIMVGADGSIIVFVVFLLLQLWSAHSGSPEGAATTSVNC
jgi:hypothetical protein